jgi:hypothetical protein
MHLPNKWKKCKQMFARKLLATVFWDRTGKGWWWNSCKKGPQLHHNVLENTKKNCAGLAIQNKKQGMLASCAMLLHDNACPETSTATHTWALLEDFNWELYDHFLYRPILPHTTTTCLTTWKTGWDQNSSTVMSWWKVPKCGCAHRRHISFTKAHKTCSLIQVPKFQQWFHWEVGTYFFV